MGNVARVGLIALLGGCAAGEPAIQVLAAASLTDALQGLGPSYEAETGRRVSFSFDGTSRLAAQLRSGRPADVFFAADTAWMEALHREGLVQQPRALLANELVVVAPASASPPSGWGEVSRLALAGESVPAGRYARQALAAEGVAVEEVVSGASVRHVLAWVARGEVPAGVVYRTDARIEPRVQIAWAVPASAHEPIVYPVALTAGASLEAAAFVAWLGEQAPVFEAAGFRVLR